MAEIYRIIHYSNLDFILKHGMFSKNSQHKDPNYYNIGDTGLIYSRGTKIISLTPGGVLNDYVPFYFGKHSPMLLKIHTGLVSGVTCGQNEIIYVVCSDATISANQIPFVFTDGHAYDNLSRFYDNLLFLSNLDWNVINAKFWANTPIDTDRQRRKQAEFLAFQKVPKDCILEIVVYDDNMKTIVDNILIANNCTNIPCNVRSGWYY